MKRSRRAIPTLERCEDRALMAILLGATPANALLRFESTAPGTILGTTPFTGLPAGQTLLGTAVRPATGELVGLFRDAGNVGRLFNINPATGAATPLATLAEPLVGDRFGLTFDPTQDVLGVVGADARGLLFNPTTGALVNAAPAAFVAGDPNFGVAPQIQALGFTEAVGGAAPQLLGIDVGRDVLVRGTVTPTGVQLTTLGPLGVDATEVGGFDIFGANEAVAALGVGGLTQLFTINPATGAATLVGPIGAGTTPLVGISQFNVTPVPGAGVLGVAQPLIVAQEALGFADVVVTRTGGTEGAVSALLNVVGGTAVAGQDFLGTSFPVIFPAGVTTQTVRIPLLQDNLAEPNETLILQLANPTGGATLGPVSQMIVTILDNPATRQDGPIVAGPIQRFGFHAQRTVLQVPFSGDLDPATVANLNNFVLRDAATGRVTPIRGAQFDPTTRLLTLFPAGRLPLNRRFELGIRGGDLGIRDVFGNRLGATAANPLGQDFVTGFGREALVGPANGFGNGFVGGGRNGFVGGGRNGFVGDVGAFRNGVGNRARFARSFVGVAARPRALQGAAVDQAIDEGILAVRRLRRVPLVTR